MKIVWSPGDEKAMGENLETNGVANTQANRERLMRMVEDSLSQQLWEEADYLAEVISADGLKVKREVEV